VSKISISESLLKAFTQHWQLIPLSQDWVQVSSFAIGFELTCNENAEFPNPASIKYDATTGSVFPGIEYCLYSVIGSEIVSSNTKDPKSNSSETTIKIISPAISSDPETLASITTWPIPNKLDVMYSCP